MMAKSHRLGRLQMGEARHNRVGMSIGFCRQNAHQRMNLRADMLERVAHIKPKVGRHLVITASAPYAADPPHRR